MVEKVEVVIDESNQLIKKVECAVKILPWLKKLKATCWVIVLAPFLTLMGNIISPWAAYAAVFVCIIVGGLLMNQTEKAIKELKTRFSM